MCARVTCVTKPRCARYLINYLKVVIGEGRVIDLVFFFSHVTGLSVIPRCVHVHIVVAGAYYGVE